MSTICSLEAVKEHRTSVKDHVAFDTSKELWQAITVTSKNIHISRVSD